MYTPRSQGEEETAALLERIVSGDRQAEESLMLHFRPRILTFLRVRLQDRETAEELCHDVLIALLSRLRQGRLQLAESLGSYVFGITRNVFSDYLAGRSKHRTAPFPENFDLPSPPVDTSFSERHEITLAALDRLDKLDREILRLTLVNGMKPAQIAERLKLSGDVVRQRKTRAVTKLSQFLREPSQKPSGR